MLRVLIIALILASGGLMVWQMEFAAKEVVSRSEPPLDENPYPGVPRWIAERSPAAAAAIHNVQFLFSGPRETEEKPTIRRGTRTAPDNWDIRYSRRPGDRN